MFSKKAIKVVIASVTLTALTGGTLVTYPAEASRENIAELSQDNIKNKVHVRKFEEFKNDHRALKAYIAQLSTKELLEAASEMAELGEYTLDQQGIILVPELKKRWGKGTPQELEGMFKDKSKNKKFRLFLIDHYIGVVKGDETHDEVAVDSLVSLASDKLENEDIRRYALLKIRKQSKKADKKKSHESSLVKIFNDPDTPPSVKGAALTAMKRTGNPHLQHAVEGILLNAEGQPGIVIRHAVAEGAKSGKFKDVGKMKDLAKKTADAEVYATTVYSLGLLKNQEAVKAIVEVAGRHNNPDIAGYALMQNQHRILEMLDLTQPKDALLAAITASELIQLHAAIEKLERIAVETTDSNVRSKAEHALVVIKATPVSGVPSNAHKWEDVQ